MFVYTWGFLFFPLIAILAPYAHVHSSDSTHFDTLPEPIITDNSYAASEAARLFAFYRTRPTNPSICIDIAKVLVSTSCSERAVPWFKKALLLDPSSTCRKDLIDLLLRLEKPSAALPHALWLSKRAPRDSGLASWALEIAIWADSTPKIAELAERLSELSTDDATLKRCMELLAYAKHPTKALVLAKKRLSSRPRDASLLQTVSEMAEWSGNQAESIKYLQQAQSISPTLDRGALLIRKILSIGNIPRAQQEFMTLMNKLGCSTQSVTLMTNLAYEARLATEGLSLFNRYAGEINPERLLLRAELERMAGHIAEAADDINKALETYPRLLDKAALFSAYLSNAECNVLLGHFNSACIDFRLAARFHKLSKPAGGSDDGSADSIFWSWVNAARKAGRASEEEEALAPLAARNKTDPTIFLRLAELAEKRSDSALAIERLERGLANIPNNIDLNRGIAKLLLACGSHSAALPHLELCLSQNPDDLFARENMASIAVSAGNDAYVVSLLSPIYPSHPSRNILLMLAPSLHQIGRRDKALELMREYLEMDPFDAEMEIVYKNIAEGLPEDLKKWEEKKAREIDHTYSALLATVDNKLASDPRSISALTERATIRLWQNDPAAALVDLEAIQALQPGDISNLRRTIDAAEWAGLTGKTLELRHLLQDFEPEDATNTLRIAQLLGWRHAQHIAWPLYSKLLARSDLDSIQVLLPAVPVAVWAGRYDDAHRMHKALRPHLLRMKPDELRDFKQQSADLTYSVGPRIDFTYAFRHDTEAIADLRHQIRARHSVENGRVQETMYERVHISQNARRSRDFQGATWTSTWYFPATDGFRWSIGLGLLDNRSDRTVTPFIPRIVRSSSQYGRNTELAFDEQPVTDTPEALRRNMTLRKFSISHALSLAHDRNFSIWANAGSYSGGIFTNSGGAIIEQRMHLNPKYGWQYQYAYSNTARDGEGIFFAPHHLITHRVSWFGEHSFDEAKLGWEVEAGHEMKLASFYGSRASLQMPLRSGWNIRLDGSVLNASKSHLGAGQGGFHQWQLQTRLEHTSW